MADTGRERSDQRAYGRGRQVLVDTIRNDFGVDVNNYIEVDFRGFKGLVNAHRRRARCTSTPPMRDGNTGLDISQPGCVTLDGDQALAFARSRHLQFKDGEGRWEDDPTGDLGRITRQQVFVRTALHKALSLGLLTNPKTFLDLLNVATDTRDDRPDDRPRRPQRSCGCGSKSWTPSQIETYSLPVTDHMTTAARRCCCWNRRRRNRSSTSSAAGIPNSVLGGRGDGERAQRHRRRRAGPPTWARHCLRSGSRSARPATRRPAPTTVIKLRAGVGAGGRPARPPPLDPVRVRRSPTRLSNRIT